MFSLYDESKKQLDIKVKRLKEQELHPIKKNLDKYLTVSFLLPEIDIGLLFFSQERSLSIIKRFAYTHERTAKVFAKSGLDNVA